MDSLVKKLALALFVGLVIVGLAYVLADPAEKNRLTVEAISHLGIIILGIAAVEVVWAWAGGSPIELNVSRLITFNEGFSDKLKEDLDALSRISSDVKSTSVRIEESVQHMTTIVTAANRTGLANVGASQDELGYPPSRFAADIKGARNGIDLCGCTLTLINSNDAVFEALCAADVPVRLLLPDPDSLLRVAIFKDRFDEPIRMAAQSLSRRIIESKSNIQLKLLSKKALTMSMLRIDEAMLVVPYMYSVQTPESPRFDVRGSNNLLFRAYCGEFEALFDLAEPAASRT